MGKFPPLAALSPFGPIFGKELRTTARRKRTYALRFFYLLILMLVLLAVWSGTAFQREHSASVAERAQNDARLGGEFFAAFSMFSVFALAAIAPILTATAVNAERQAKTLPVLLMTPITSWQIVSGKLLSRLLAALMLIGLSLPVLAVVRLLGSLEIEQMVGVLSLCVVISLAGAAIGLFYSTVMNRAFAVILMSYGTMAILYAFVPFVMVLSVVRRGGPPGRWFTETLLAINPFFSAMTILEPRGMGRLMGVRFVPCVVVHCTMTALLVWLSAVMIRRLARREGEKAGAAAPATPDDTPSVAPAPDGMVEQGVAGGPPVSFPRKATGEPPATRRTVSDNPVLWRELRRPLMAKRSQAIIGSIVVVGMLLFTYGLIASTGGPYSNPLSEPDLQIGYAFIFWGTFALLSCVLAATTIAGEKESDTWTLLLATPMSGREIVLGKLLGIFRRMLWPAALITAHFAIFTVCGVISVASFLLILWVTFAFNTLWIATGLYYSLRARKVTFAVILNLLTPLAAYLLIPVLLEIFSNLALEHNSSLSEVVLWYAPFFYLAKGISHLSDRSSSLIYMPMSYGHASVWEFLAIALAVGACYVALAAAVVGYTIRKFDRIVGRAGYF